MSFFGSKSKKEKPGALIKHAKQGVQNFHKHKGNTSKQEKAVGEIAGSIAGMKLLLYGDGKAEPTPELGDELVNEILANDLISLLIENIGILEFEVRPTFHL
jgi:calcium binding protein 39